MKDQEHAVKEHACLLLYLCGTTRPNDFTKTMQASCVYYILKQPQNWKNYHHNCAKGTRETYHKADLTIIQWNCLGIRRKKGGGGQ